MESIAVFDDNYPVKTIVSSKEDWENNIKWQDIDSRNNIIKNYINAPIKRVVYANETHSGNVMSVSENDQYDKIEKIYEPYIIKQPGGYDSIITERTGIFICVRTADCVPLFVYDTFNHVAAIVHCGWRSICSKIVANTIGSMKKCYGTKPQHLVTAFGPAICKDCYEVGDELIHYFAQEFSPNVIDEIFKPKEGGKYLLDLRRAIVIELVNLGVIPSNICDTSDCSYESNKYASYRRDGRNMLYRETLSGIVLL